MAESSDSRRIAVSLPDRMPAMRGAAIASAHCRLAAPRTAFGA
jgi:hypothetical protein